MSLNHAVDHMLVRIPAILLWAFIFPSLAQVQTWTSPDGFLTVAAPEPSTFQAIPSPPAPFIALWISNDEVMKFGVLKTAIPTNIRLNQSAAEEGFAEEIGGIVTRLPTRQISGHEVWEMNAKGASGEIRQAMIRHDDALYKVMAATVGGAVDANLVDQFISSLTIAESSGAEVNSQLSKKSATQPVQDQGSDLVHTLSKSVGGASALLAIGLLIYVVWHGKSAKTR